MLFSAKLLYCVLLHVMHSLVNIIKLSPNNCYIAMHLHTVSTYTYAYMYVELHVFECLLAYNVHFTK